MIKSIDGSFDQKLWNATAVHPMQSWEWGEARKQMRIEVLRIGEYQKNNLKNVFQVTFHKVPFTSFKIGYLPRSVFPTKEVLDFLHDYGKKHNVVYIKLEPNEKKNSSFVIPHSSLRKSPAPLFPKWTQIIDLTKSEEELLKNMKPKTRYNVKLAQKKGVAIKEITNEEGFEIFIKLYFETTKRQKYFGHSYEYHRTIFETLKNKVAHILIAYYQKKPVAAYELFLFHNTLYYPYGGSSEEFREVMGTNLLMWEAMRFGKKHGAKIFDLWGSLPPDYDRDGMWAGFTRFKEGYGSTFQEMIGSFDLVLNSPLYYILTAAQKIREKLMS